MTELRISSEELVSYLAGISMNVLLEDHDLTL